MTVQAPIVCKPTRWFFVRAFAMLGMFLVFTGWFYYDANIGYRSKNETFFTERAFHKAVADFTRLNRDGELTPESWRQHAAGQSIEFPEEEGILPVSLDLPAPWPELLHDHEKVKSLNPATLWREYTASRGWEISLPEDYYSSRKIRDQWVVFWICLGLSLAALFILIRTLGRSISADGEAITDVTGRRIPYTDLTRLDLRKWDTKGIAFADYNSAGGSGRIRIDGLTYGGFRHEENQPAERLMEMLRANFSGELLEYAAAASPNPTDDEPGGEAMATQTDGTEREVRK